MNYLARHWILGHLWSLGVEEQFYLLWPGILKKCYRFRTVILIAVFALSPVYNVALHYFKWFNAVGPVTLPSVADNLAIGCLIATFATRWPKISKPLFAICVILVLAIPWYDANSAARTAFVFFVLYPLMEIAIGGILIHAVQNPYRVLNVAPVVWLGQISYSLYLWQQPFLDPASPTRYGILAAFAMACVSYYLIERPLLRYRDMRIPAISTSRRTEAVAA